MEQKRKDEESKAGGMRTALRGPNIWVAILGLAIILSLILMNRTPEVSQISSSDLEKFLQGKQYDGTPIKDKDGKEVKSIVETITIDDQDNSATGTFTIAPKAPPKLNAKGELVLADDDQLLKKQFSVQMPSPDSEYRSLLDRLINEKGVRRGEASPNNAMNIVWGIFFLLPFVILLLLWLSYRRSQNQMLGGGGFLSGFSRSPAKRYEPNDKPITFNDVAGLEGVKADLVEIVEYLKDPDKFRRLGGRVPKGVLLNGPPGTGKTLLARAVAGEANVPFYSVNGSEFIQMFVGVGASRVRDLFKTAKDTGPAIIFIDEIDAVGRQRGAGLGGGHDEREQTLNQILSEMDGFQGVDTVIVIAATNRPDVLDPALLRPGRFDRHITVSRPTQRGRLEIFKVHVKDVLLGSDVDLEALASATVGMTGADIRNLVNEAALWAARQDKKQVEMEDFEYARDKIQMGAKREEILTEKDKEKTAYHEAGHALTAWYSKGAYPVHKVTVIPRGRALGVTQMLPDEDRMNFAESELHDHLVMLLGGRAAEKLIYDELSVGAENDLDRATGMARRMVTRWGMSKNLGPVSYKLSDDDPFLGREMHQQRQFSEHTMQMIDAEVTHILQTAAQDALTMLTKRRDELEKITRALMEKEEITRDDIEQMIGPGVHKPRKFALLSKNGDKSVAGDKSLDDSSKPSVENDEAEEGEESAADSHHGANASDATDSSVSTSNGDTKNKSDQPADQKNG
jgi:cell division protease FtsH